MEECVLNQLSDQRRLANTTKNFTTCTHNNLRRPSLLPQEQRARRAHHVQQRTNLNSVSSACRNAKAKQLPTKPASTLPYLEFQGHLGTGTYYIALRVCFYAPAATAGAVDSSGRLSSQAPV
jgi:hypothetical protein